MFLLTAFSSAYTMTSNLSIGSMGQRSQAFHSSMYSRKIGRTNFNAATASTTRQREAAMCNYQNQWRAEESPGPDLPLQNSKIQSSLTYVWTENGGLRIIDLPSKALAEGLEKAFKAGIASCDFEVTIEELGSEKFGLHFPFTGKYDYRPFRKGFEQRIDFLVDEYFLKNPFSAESEVN